MRLGQEGRLAVMHRCSELGVISGRDGAERRSEGDEEGDDKGDRGGRQRSETDTEIVFVRALGG